MNPGVDSSLPCLVVLDDVPGDPSRLCLPDGAIFFVPDHDGEVREDITHRSVKVVTAADPEMSLSSADHKAAATDIMEQLWTTEIGGRTLEEHFTHEGVRFSTIAHTPLVTGLVDTLGRLSAIVSLIEREGPTSVLVPRQPGPWSTLAIEAAGARGISVSRISGYPPGVPLWPPTRRAITSRVPTWIKRWAEARTTGRNDAVWRADANPKPADMTADAIALMEYVGEVRTLSPVIDLAQETRGITIGRVVDTLGAAPDACRKHGEPFHTLQKDHGWRESGVRVRTEFQRMSGIWKQLLQGGTGFAPTYLGVPVIPVVRDTWRMLSDLTRDHRCLWQYLWWSELIGDALEDWKPKLVMLADEAMPFETCVLEHCGLGDISTLCVLHGAMPDHPKHTRGRSTRITVNGELSRRFLLSLGTEDERIVVTGLPQFDPLADAESFAEVPVRRDLGIPDDIPLIVFTMQSGQGLTPMGEVIPVVAEVVRLAESMRGRYAFVFKQHPADRGNLLVNIMGVDPDALGIALIYDYLVHPLLYHADLVITQMSTTGQEALLLEKPLVIMNLSGKPDSIPYVEYGAAVGVYQAGELDDAVRRALGDVQTRDQLAEGRARFVSDFAYRMDGRATERILDVLDELLESD
jgi:hypothetical protein